MRQGEMYSQGTGHHQVPLRLFMRRRSQIPPFLNIPRSQTLSWILRKVLATYIQAATGPLSIKIQIFGADLIGWIIRARLFVKSTF